MRKKIIFVVGPTAVGKTKLAIKLAKRVNGEIVSCDSMQVYKGLNILSSKPSRAQAKQAKHHLVSIIRPSQNFDVSKFIKLGKAFIERIHKKGCIPIFVGGTGLYLDCLLNGIFIGPKKNSRIRSELYKKAKAYGNDYLHKRLKKFDKQAAKRIHVHDLRRIVRALEVYQITKRPLSLLQKQRKGILQEKKFRIYIFGLNLAREELYEKINKRVDRMFKKGVVKEVKRLLSKRNSRTFNQALGIREINSYLKGEINLMHTKQLLKRNTRRYAKRQLTWFRKNKMVHWLNRGESTDIIDIIATS